MKFIFEVIGERFGIFISVLMGVNIVSEVVDEKFCEIIIGESFIIIYIYNIVFVIAFFYIFFVFNLVIFFL